MYYKLYHTQIKPAINFSGDSSLRLSPLPLPRWYQPSAIRPALRRVQGSPESYVIQGAFQIPHFLFPSHPVGRHGRGADEAGVVAELGQEDLGFAIEVGPGKGRQVFSDCIQ
jgi:hypothetical protein